MVFSMGGAYGLIMTASFPRADFLCPFPVDYGKDAVPKSQKREVKKLQILSQVLIPGAAWGRNLDAFNDILRGGFGTPEGGFVLQWINSALSRERLGYPETVRRLTR